MVEHARALRVDWRYFVVAALALSARVALGLSALPEFVDDAYIHLRYIENWTSGQGLVYNPGDKILGFSSYLWVFFISAIDRATGAVANIAIVKAVNYLLFGVFSIVLWHLLDRRWLLYWPTVVLLLFYFPFVDATLSGMETQLFVLILAATLVSVQKDAPVAAAALSALAAVTRPEGVLLLVAVAVGLWSSITWRQRAWSALAATAIGMAALVPIYAYFGTIFPNSMLAKSGQVTSAVEGGSTINPFVDRRCGCS